MKNKCQCNSSYTGNECLCYELISGSTVAKTAEQLMRSRYTAFATGAYDYLYQTSSSELKKQLTPNDLKQACDQYQFVHLNVLNSTENTVEFKASLIANNYLQYIHELSEFIVEDGLLKYHTGQLFETPEIKLERNSPCPCQSGLKYKKCHGK